MLVPVGEMNPEVGIAADNAIKAMTSAGMERIVICLVIELQPYVGGSVEK